MAILIIEHGPDAGRRFTLTLPETTLGRQVESTVHLSAKAVSRQHAQILQENGQFLLKDLGSSNGTFLNGQRLLPNSAVPIGERDRVQIGPYVLALGHEPTLTSSEGTLVIRESVPAHGVDESLYGQAPAQKLQVVLEIAQHLGRTLDVEEVLAKLLDQVMRLFPQADRSMILLLEGDSLIVRDQRCRHEQEPSTFPYSKTVVQQALDQGIGILSQDVQEDERFDNSTTLAGMNLHSLLCVPMICHDGRRLGVIQIDRYNRGTPFRSEDLHMLTTICLQVAVVLDNAQMHKQLLQEERLRQELELAREIQQGFLPDDFETDTNEGFEIFACVHSARKVSGDLYDFRRLDDGRLSFFIGDVAGKGMPAALLTVAVHTLSRHLTLTGTSPSNSLQQLSESLVKENPTGRFVTLAHGIYEPSRGEMILASAGHPLPLLRRANGDVEDLPHKAGRPLGFEGLPLNVSDYRFALNVGDMLIFFTDGLVESRHPDSRELYKVDGLRKLAPRFDKDQSLGQCAEMTRHAIQEFTRSADLQDDLTLLFLRRRS